MHDNIALPDAIRQLRMAMPRPRMETRHPLEALGMVLASPAKTAHASPASDVSAMDGYAVRSGDTPGRLTRRATSRPGKPTTSDLLAGECWSILTGAPLPKGADAVVPMEEALWDETTVQVPASRPGSHVVPTGSANPEGLRIRPGTRISIPLAACLAASGTPRVKVHSRLPVRLIPLGSELVDGSVPDFLSPLLAHQLDANGCMVNRIPCVEDDATAMGAALQGPEPLIVTTGGTGPSESDLVARLGADGILFDGINVKPGRPTKAIRLPDGRLWLALPGNPVSALLVTAGILVPALREALQGPTLPKPTAPVAQTIPGHPSRWRITPVLATPKGLVPCEPGPSVAPGWLREADGVVNVPPATTLGVGSFAEVWTW